MAKNSWNDYSATAANNTDVGNVNTSETMNPSDVNDAVRELMSHTADVVAGTVALSSINIDGGSVTGITDLAVADGGTGASTLTANGVLFGNGTSAIGVTAVGTSGQVLTSNGSSAPTFQDAATTYTHPNHSGEVTSTGDGATVIASNVVDEDNLKVSNAPTNGYILTARSGNTGGLTWEAAAGGGASNINGLSDGKTIGGSAGTNAWEQYSIGLGYQAFNSATAQLFASGASVALGWYSGAKTTSGQQNVYIGGSNANYYTNTASYNIGIGPRALQGVTTGGSNTVVATNGSGQNISTGTNNCLFGYTVGRVITTGSFNIGIGSNSLYNVSTTNHNIGIGENAGYTGAGGNCIMIGQSAYASSSSATNEITLGNSSISSLRCQVQTISSLSDRRDKKDIEELPIGIDFINTLKPVKFTWNMRDGAKVGQQEAGFIAQDLDEAQIDAGAEDYLSLVLKNNPDKLEAAYGKLVPVLVKAVQELSAEVKTLKREIENGK